MKSMLQFAAEGLRPRPEITVSEWADANRRLTSTSSNEEGPWRTSRVPYLREPMDCLSTTSPVRKVVLMFGSQLGKTEAINNWLGYIITEVPGPVLIVYPDLPTAKRYSKYRVAPMIEACKALREKVREARSRDSGNTMLLKEFPGGVVSLVGANSATGMRSMPARFLCLDEVDGYEGDADGEGDPVRLAERALRTFDASYKEILTSTPLIDGRSRIQAAYQLTDRSRWYMPCPDCGHFQILVWSSLRWDEGDPSSVRMACSACGALHEESKKTWMLEHGEWRADAPELSDRVRGFHLTGLCSPYGWYSWRSAVEYFLEAKGKANEFRPFVNTVLGEAWREASDPPPAKKIWLRRSKRPSRVVPEGALVLTSGVDVQKDRIELEVVGWGRGMRSWSIEYLVLPGSPEQQDVWRMLEQALTVTYPHERVPDLHLAIRGAGIDTGHATTIAYAFVRRYPPDRVFALRGDERVPTVVGAPTKVDIRTSGKRMQRAVNLWRAGVGIVKGELYGYLNQDPAEEGEPTPVGWCDFPKDYQLEYFEQLCSEQLVPHTVGKHSRFPRKRYVWEKTRERNEALDCRVYARVVAEILGLARWTDADWDAIERGLGAPPSARPAASARTSERARRPGDRGAREPGWLEGYGDSPGWL